MCSVTLWHGRSSLQQTTYSSFVHRYKKEAASIMTARNRAWSKLFELWIPANCKMQRKSNGQQLESRWLHDGRSECICCSPYWSALHVTFSSLWILLHCAISLSLITWRDVYDSALYSDMELSNVLSSIVNVCFYVFSSSWFQWFIIIASVYFLIYWLVLVRNPEVFYVPTVFNKQIGNFIWQRQYNRLAHIM